jgi:hypothetical protein
MTDNDKRITEFTNFSREGKQKYELEVGTQVRLLPEMPPYEVTSISTGKPPVITFTLRGNPTYNYTSTRKNKLTGVEESEARTAILPEKIELQGDKLRTIGRESSSDGLINVTSVSGTHATVHFDKAREKFILTATNLNKGKIRNATQLGHDRVRDVVGAAMTMMVGGGNDTEDGIDVPLRPGMIVQILPNTRGTKIPPYVVKKAVGGSRPELVMECEDKSKGFPDIIQLNGKDACKLIGRGGADFEMNHAGIHRMHATLAWDDVNKNWSYMTTYDPPSIQVGNQFLQDMRDASERVTPRDVNDARRQISDIDMLINDMQAERSQMKNVLQMMADVQKLEARTILTPEHERHRGAKTEDSQSGYRNWLRAYKILYQESLDPATAAALDTGMGAMTAMERNRDALRELEGRAYVNNMPGDMMGALKACKAAGYGSQMQAVVDRECEPLKAHPPKPAFIVSGFQGHHTVTRIDKDAQGYVVTTYNAGAGAKEAPDGSGNVMAMYRQRLDAKVPVEDFIRLVNERKIRPYLSLEGAQFEEMMGKALGPVKEYRIEPPQHKGNCTTRSTREMLKDMMDPAAFEHMHRHVSNPDVCDPAEVMAALQMRREALDGYIQKQGQKPVAKPRNQADWSKSVSDLRLSIGSQSIDGLNPGDSWAGRSTSQSGQIEIG